MKKKAKLIATLSSLGLALAMMVFAVYAATSVTFKVTTNVSFEATKHVQATITARDSGATNTVLTVDSANYPNKATTGADQTINVDGTGKTVDGEGNEIAGLQDIVFAEAELTATNKYYGYQITIKNDDNENELPIEVTAPTKTGTGYEVKFTGATKTTIGIGATHVITCIIEIKDLAGNKVEVKNSDMALDIKLGEEDSSTEEELEPTLDYLTFHLFEDSQGLDGKFYCGELNYDAINAATSTQTYGSTESEFNGQIVFPNVFDDGINGKLPVRMLCAYSYLLDEVFGDDYASAVEKVTSIIIPNSVVNISQTFNGCTSLEYVIIPESVTEIVTAFENCPKVSFFCESKFEPKDYSLSISLMRPVYCAGEWEYDLEGNPTPLTDEELEATLDKLIFKFVENGEESYYNTSVNLTLMREDDNYNGEIIVPAYYGRYPVKGFNNSSGAFLSKVTSINFPNTIETLGLAALYGSKITKIKIPDSVVTIGEGAFGACQNLSTVVIPSSVKTTGRVLFEDCPSNIIIFCEAEEQPSDWDSNWNSLNYNNTSKATVYWAGEWHYDAEGNPVPNA